MRPCAAAGRSVENTVELLVKNAALVGIETANDAAKPQISTAITIKKPLTAVVVYVITLITTPVDSNGCSSSKRLKAFSKTPTAPKCSRRKRASVKCAAEATYNAAIPARWQTFHQLLKYSVRAAHIVSRACNVTSRISQYNMKLLVTNSAICNTPHHIAASAVDQLQSGLSSLWRSTCDSWVLIISATAVKNRCSKYSSSDCITRRRPYVSHLYAVATTMSLLLIEQCVELLLWETLACLEESRIRRQ